MKKKNDENWQGWINVGMGVELAFSNAQLWWIPRGTSTPLYMSTVIPQPHNLEGNQAIWDQISTLMSFLFFFPSFFHSSFFFPLSSGTWLKNLDKPHCCLSKSNDCEGLNASQVEILGFQMQHVLLVQLPFLYIFHLDFTVLG